MPAREPAATRTFDLAVALGVGGFLLLVGLTTPVTERNGRFDSDGVFHFYLGNYLTPIGAFPQYPARLVPIHSPGSAYASVLASRLVLSALWLGFTVLILRRARL